MLQKSANDLITRWTIYAKPCLRKRNVLRCLFPIIRRELLVKIFMAMNYNLRNCHSLCFICLLYFNTSVLKQKLIWPNQWGVYEVLLFKW